MPRVKYIKARQQSKSAERRRAAWELYRAGATGGEIGAALGITRQHANELIRKERKALADETRANAEGYRVEEIARTSLAIREAAKIITAACPTCRGQGRIAPDGPATLPGDMTDCTDCAGTGRRYDVNWRLKAIDRFLRAVDMRARLRGLYVPHAIPDPEGLARTFTQELSQIGDDDLDRELEAFMAGLATAEKRAEAPENGDRPSYHD